MGLALLSAVLGGLDAPAWAWIVVAGFALLAFARAYALHVKEGVERPMPADSSASPTADGRVYGSAAIRQAISEDSPQPGGEMRSIRLSREMLVERPAQKKCDLVVAELVAMIDEGDKLKGNAFGGEAAPSDEVLTWRESVVTFVGFALGDLERQRLLEVEPTGPDIEGTLDAMLGWLRQRRDDSVSWEARVRELDGLELDAAIEARRGQQPAALGESLDNMIREGRELVAELSAPIKPEKLNWAARVEAGTPPAAWQAKADAFRQGAHDLLEQRHPALLADYREGCNYYIQESPESDGLGDPLVGTRSDAEKTLALANYERQAPAREVKACLEGLARARKSI